MSDTARPYPPPECPPAPDAVADAYLSAARLAAAARIKPETAERLRPVCMALIEEYAPGAPQPVKDEAVIRFAGYLAQSPPAAISKISTGPLDVEFYRSPPNSQFQLSGAKALLTRWKRRRGGVIG